MVRVGLKNTFLELRAEASDEEELECNGVLQASPPRSRTGTRARSLDSTPLVQRSCEASPALHQDSGGTEAGCLQELELQLASLNRLLGSPFCRRQALDDVASASPFFPRRSEAATPQSRLQQVESSSSSLCVHGEEQHLSSTASMCWSSAVGSCAASSDDGHSDHCSACSVDADASTAPPKEEDFGEPQMGFTKVKGYMHKRVPKKTDLTQGTSEPSGQPVTTLMLRNIPNRLKQSDLMQELELLGFAGTYDFLYVPLDRGQKAHRHHGLSRNATSNVGYAFVNFVDPEWAERCIAVFQDRSFSGSTRTTRVSPAHVQGLAANLSHYESAAVMNNSRLRECRPVVLAHLSSRFGYTPPVPR